MRVRTSARRAERSGNGITREFTEGCTSLQASPVARPTCPCRSPDAGNPAASSSLRATSSPERRAPVRGAMADALRAIAPRRPYRSRLEAARRVPRLPTRTRAPAAPNPRRAAPARARAAPARQPRAARRRAPPRRSAPHAAPTASWRRSPDRPSSEVPMRRATSAGYQSAGSSGTVTGRRRGARPRLPAGTRADSCRCRRRGTAPRCAATRRAVPSRRRAPHSTPVRATGPRCASCRPAAARARPAPSGSALAAARASATRPRAGETSPRPEAEHEEVVALARLVRRVVGQHPPPERCARLEIQVGRHTERAGHGQRPERERQRRRLAPHRAPARRAEGEPGDASRAPAAATSRSPRPTTWRLASRRTGTRSPPAATAAPMRAEQRSDVVLPARDHIRERRQRLRVPLIDRADRGARV